MCRQLSLCFEGPWRESAVERKWICRNWGARPSDQHLEQPDASVPQRVESNTSDMGINLQTPQHVAESGGTYCAANLACVKKKKFRSGPSSPHCEEQLRLIACSFSGCPHAPQYPKRLVSPQPADATSPCPPAPGKPTALGLSHRRNADDQG